jgi:carbon-monoxide dehydrogenase medium subunit
VKPAPFQLHSPRSSDEVLELLGEFGEDAKVLAGGQSLVPMMNMRLARPAHLIDLNRVESFAGLVELPDGAYQLGPLVRHYDAEMLAGAPGVGGYLGRVAPTIAHLPVRVRGTVAGSLAHADPASEWCAALVAASASVVVRSAAGQRTLAVEDFLQGSFMTALQPDEMVAAIRVPEVGDGEGLGFAEVSRRAGDFALALSAAALAVREGRITRARVVIGAMGGGVSRCADAEEALTGQAASPSAIAEAGDVAADRVEAYGDVHSSPAHRRHLVRVVVARALDAAARDARRAAVEQPAR